ncbi:hypothetical protein GC173_13710 [bacterium]|nr:hypothetical protein [bacterium]
MTRLILRLATPTLALLACLGCFAKPQSDDLLEPIQPPPEFQTLPMRGLPKDPAMSRFLEPYKAQVDLWKTPIGRSVAALNIVRYECPLNTLIADMARRRVSTVTGQPVDLLMLNGGGIRANLPEGDVSYYDIAQILPFENTLVLIELDAQKLQSVMSAIAAQKGRTAISGFTLEADAEGKLLSFLIDGREADPTRTYRFATVDFLANGAGGFEVFKDMPHQETGQLLREAVADELRAMTARGEAMQAPTDYSRQRFGGLRTEEMTW